MACLQILIASKLSIILHWLKYPSDSISRYDKFVHTYLDSYQT